jgi:hypothetical protein
MEDKIFICMEKCIFIPPHTKLATGSISSRSVRFCVYALVNGLVSQDFNAKYFIISMDTLVSHLSNPCYEPRLPYLDYLSNTNHGATHSAILFSPCYFLPLSQITFLCAPSLYSCPKVRDQISHR